MTVPEKRSIMYVTVLSHCDAGGLPVVCRCAIATHCPRCGAARGDPVLTVQECCGHFYCAHVWTNACGHVDDHGAIAAEGRRRLATLLLDYGLRRYTQRIKERYVADV